MRKFTVGFLLGVLAVAASSYVYIHYGFVDLRADQPLGVIERTYMRGAMDKYADRYSPKAENPVSQTDANMIEGIRLYKANCAVCHGGPDKPVAAMGFSPRAPQFLSDAPDMPEYQNFWITKRGIKLTGMPAWDRALSDVEIWKVTTFLSRMEDLDKLSPAVQAAWKGGAQAEMGTPQPHGESEVEHQHHHEGK
ncbi:MAG: c-type cytochrome [Terriglobales bacterium]|jgi:thiosulfate dehydrogenase